MKIGRNEPCPCGSGKKYKQCHGPIDAERESAQRRVRQTPDTLLPRLMDQLDRFGAELPATLQRFWNGAYDVADVQELDQLEDRGSERFLTWFLFDAANEQGQTPIERLIAAPEGLELTDAEAQVFLTWAGVRLQPYEVTGIRKGFGLELRTLFGEESIELEDHKASRRIEAGDVLIAHVIPAGDRHYLTGAAAHLTPDTVVKLHEFADAHLADMRRATPDATHVDLVRARSEIFNHFIMALPREPQEAGKLDELVMKTRVALNLTAGQFGLGARDESADANAESIDDDAEAESEAVAAGQESYDGTED
jgi:hypothetical protein